MEDGSMFMWHVHAAHRESNEAAARALAVRRGLISPLPPAAYQLKFIAVAARMERDLI